MEIKTKEDLINIIKEQGTRIDEMAKKLDSMATNEKPEDEKKDDVITDNEEEMTDEEYDEIESLLND